MRRFALADVLRKIMRLRLAASVADRQHAFVPRMATMASLGVFWGGFVALNTARAAFLHYPHQWASFQRRVVVAVVGMFLAWLMHRALDGLRPLSLRWRIGLTVAMSLPAAIAFASVNYLVFDVVAPIPGEPCGHGLGCTLTHAVDGISDLATNWAFVFTAWGMLYLSLASAAQIREADQRAAGDREAARLAEIRALRYQINPHFLFNLLNTLSTLVIKRQLAEAETLIGEIGRFFRYSLAADPVADSILSDEIAMQARYLDLERRRFPSRLNTEFDIADGVTTALVPSLILQPLVENAIKHGVGRTGAAVTISIRASETPGHQLRIVVEDDALPEAHALKGDLTTSAAGLGVGLKNVAERLRARFGAGTSCVAGPLKTGGYRVELLMPLVIA